MKPRVNILYTYAALIKISPYDKCHRCYFYRVCTLKLTCCRNFVNLRNKRAIVMSKSNICFHCIFPPLSYRINC